MAEPRDNYESMLQEAIKKATSFSSLRPPNQASFIGSRETSNDTIDYYRDDFGNFYYESHRGRAFKEQMEQANKRIRKSRYGII